MADPGLSFEMKGREIVDSVELDETKAYAKHKSGPIMSFYTFVSDSFNLELGDINVGNIAISRETSRKFNEELIKWLRKKVRASRVEVEFGMANLMYGPIMIDTLEEGRVFILKRTE